jgi:hypothetical protein
VLLNGRDESALEGNEMKRRIYLSLLLGLSVMLAYPQTQDSGDRRFPPGENVIGKVTSVNKDSLTVAPFTGGEPVTVKIGTNTRLTKQREPIKLEQIKVDDVVFARGQITGSAVEAAMVSVVPPEMVQRIQQGGMGGPQFNREDLGKKFIAGEVKAINETKLTIARPDGQSQDIEVDENTSFKKGGESITLADVKLGDFVGGPGELKDGTFVAKELRVGRPRMMMMGGPGNGPGEQKKPDSPKPAEQVPPKN